MRQFVLLTWIGPSHKLIALVAVDQANVVSYLLCAGLGPDERRILMERPQLLKHVAGQDRTLASSGPSTGRHFVALPLCIVILTLLLSFVFIFGALAKSDSESILTGKGIGPSRTAVGAPAPTKDRSSVKSDARSSIRVLNSDSPRVNFNPVSVTCTTNPVVTNNAEGGAGSLRQAILDACDGSTITFSSFFNTAQTITLASQLLIDKSLTITGPGANLLTISGNNAVRIFSIATGSLNVTLTGLSVANGKATAGGGIFNDSAGTLNIANSAILSNAATNGGVAKGGGIHNNSSGTVNITSSTVSNNSAQGIAAGTTGSANGGGITNGALGTVHITNSTLSSNSASADPGNSNPNDVRLGAGGGVYNSGVMSITNSTLSGNSGSSTHNDGSAFCNGLGGAIYNQGTIDVLNSTLSGNSVIGNGANGAQGGGVYNKAGGTINITTSTISGNSAQAGGHGQGADGGGISNSGTLTITSSTVATNSAFGSSGGAFGGGVSNSSLLNITKSTISGNSAGGGTGSGGGGISTGQSNTTNVSNSIIANNNAQLIPIGAPEVRGTFTTNGNNLIGRSDGSTGFTNGSNNDLVGSIAAPINPLLDTLANNGGPTQTLALLPGSPAIDKGSAVAGIAADQRGFTRPVDLSGFANAAGGDGSDIGAFEVQAGTPDHLAFNVQPSETVAGGIITPAVTVTILDGSNNATTSTANVTLAIGANPGGGTLGGTTTVAAINGTATFGDLTINKSGAGYTLLASSSSLFGATSNPFTITCPTITLAPSTLPNGTLGFAYTNNVTASGGPAPFSFAVTSGSVPTGLTFNNDGTWNGTPTASGTFNFTVTATAASGCTGSQAYTVLVNALTISGRVTKGGNGFSGVTMTLSGGQSNTTVTDSNGNYSFTNVAGNASYTVTPSRTNYTFTPATATFNNLQGNGTANFAAALINYSISGRVAVGAGGLSGVTMTLSGGQSDSTLTDGNGNYSFLNIAGDGDYSVTPSLTGYTFNPTSRSFTNLSANQILADFAAFPTISGQIKTSNNVPLSNVVVVLSGTTSATAVSDGNGNFSFAGLTVGGNYVVTPSRTNYTFSPTLRTFTNLSTPQTADFVGTLADYAISGRVTDGANAGIGGVDIALSGSQTATTMTAANGSYSFTVPGDGNYTITPSNTNYNFTPLNFTFNTLSQNQNAANFSAMPIPPQLILDLSGPDPEQAAAIDSLFFLRDPFRVVNPAAAPFYSGTDRNTRVILFAAHLQLDPGETSASVVINLIDSNGQSYDMAAEDVRPVPNFPFAQVVFRLPDNLPAGMCTIKIRAHSQVSNSGTFRIRS